MDYFIICDEIINAHFRVHVAARMRNVEYLPMALSLGKNRPRGLMLIFRVRDYSNFLTHEFGQTRFT